MWREEKMEAYELYWIDPEGEYHLLGILPERRKDIIRITQESVIRLAATFFGEDLDVKNIYFIQVTINEHTGVIFRPTPALLKEVAEAYPKIEPFNEMLEE